MILSIFVLALIGLQHGKHNQKKHGNRWKMGKARQSKNIVGKKNKRFGK